MGVFSKKTGAELAAGSALAAVSNPLFDYPRWDATDTRQLGSTRKSQAVVFDTSSTEVEFVAARTSVFFCVCRLRWYGFSIQLCELPN